MTSWWNLVERGDPVPEWPYPVRYGKETRLAADVLVLGGGIAGCHAAVAAARRGASVLVVEKGHTSFGAYVPDLPGCVAAGITREEVLVLIREAIEFHIEGLRQEGQPIPPPSSTGEIVEVEAA